MDMKITVATPREEVLCHRKRVQPVIDLMGGQDAMIAAGERYIRRRRDEAKEKWEDRVHGATLLNAYERTLAYLSGQVFSKDVALGDEGKAVDPVWSEWADNVDGQGNNLTVFAKRAFAHGLNEGYVLILTDSAAVETRDTPSGRQYLDADGVWQPLTAAAADILGLRPRLIEVRAESVLGWRYEITGSRTRLVLLRLLESYKEEGEWDAGDVDRQQVRVLRPGSWEVWRKAREDDESTWEIHSAGTLPGTEIPVALFRPGKPMGEMAAAPALESLAKKNIEHWQKQADHNNLMSWVRYPGLFGSGFTPKGPDEDELRWGPGELTTDSNPDSKLTSIGQDAASVSASKEELKDIEAQMALFGLQMLMPRSGDVTATEKALSSAESDSTLAGWAGEFKDALEQALVFIAEFMGMDGGSAPDVEVNTEFHALAAFDDQTLTALITAATNGKLPVEVLWSEMRRRGIIAEEWTPEKIKESLRAQNLDGTFETAASTFLRVPAAGQGPNNVGSQASSGSSTDQQQNAV